jgi:hypothetical protein
VKDFFVAAKYRMKLPDGVGPVAGGLILPSGIARHTLERRDLVRKYPHLARRYLDPQLYLATLNPATCRKSCTNLATYGWFPGATLPAFDSSTHTQADWMEIAAQQITTTWTARIPTDENEIVDVIRHCVETQRSLGCAGIILPSPRTVDLNTTYAAELSWLDHGLDIAARIAPELPRFATVALSDTCLRTADPWTSNLIDLILDQITARAPEGVYLMIEQAHESGYFCTHPNTVGALLRLVDGFKHGGVDTVFVAFAGIAGLLGVIAGADAWATGWYRGERRLRLADFEQQEGRAMPAYYSHPFASEFHM